MAAAVFSLLLLGGVAATTMMRPDSALAQGEPEQVGRYQISAWASYAGARVHHSGYFVLDTVSGKVVDSGHEVHGIDTNTEGAEE
jgi:hypothetical protein